MPWGSKVPPAVKVRCVVCNVELSTRSPNAAREVVGWVIPRGAAGGANHIRDQKPTGRYAHKACLIELDQPYVGVQEGLF